MDHISIITTADGSHSLFNKTLDETYHSVHGAMQESVYVFITQGLAYYLQANPEKRNLRVLEVGFGTGLNAFLTARWSADHQINIHYESLEKFPLGKDIYEALNYAGDPESRSLFRDLHTAPWNTTSRISSTFSLEKRNIDLLETDSLNLNAFDVVYYDAFAPSKQPAMWTPGVLSKTVDALAPGGVWVTYCAKGQLKRDLRALRLNVESLPGPPGKREMLRAQKRVI